MLLFNQGFLPAPFSPLRAGFALDTVEPLPVPLGHPSAPTLVIRATGAKAFRKHAGGRDIPRKWHSLRQVNCQRLVRIAQVLNQELNQSEIDGPRRAVVS